jgi:hypothetical protein
MSKGWLIENLVVLYELSYQLPFLYGPLIYLYTRQLLQRESFRWVDLFHFMPFVILVFFFTLGYSYAESPVVLFPFLFVKFRLVLQLVSLYLYHWFAIQCLKTNSHHVERFYPTHQLKWLKRFIYTSFFVCIGVAILNFGMVILYPQLNYIRPGFLVLTLFIYWISYEALGDRSAARSNAEKALQKLETAQNIDAQFKERIRKSARQKITRLKTGT